MKLYFIPAITVFTFLTVPDSIQYVKGIPTQGDSSEAIDVKRRIYEHCFGIRSLEDSNQIYEEWLRQNGHSIIEDIKKKSNCNKAWPAHINSELVRIWRECDPRKRGHVKRVYDRWCKEQPNYACLDQGSLDARACRIIAKAEPDSFNQVNGRIHRKNQKRWTQEVENELMELWRKTHSRKTSYRKNFHEAWLRIHPEMEDVKERDLIERVYRIRKRRVKNSSANEDKKQHDIKDIVHESKKGITWPSQINSDLEKVWFECKPDERGHAQRLHQRWSQLHPDYSDISVPGLRERARHLIRTKTAEESQLARKKRKHIRRVVWTKELDDDLLKMNNGLNLLKTGRMRELHARWAEKYPKLAEMTPGALDARVKRLKRELPNHEFTERESSVEGHGVSSNSYHEQSSSQSQDKISGPDHLTPPQSPHAAQFDDPIFSPLHQQLYYDNYLGPFYNIFHQHPSPGHYTTHSDS